MKKLFKSYLLAWVILLAVYNAVVFAVRPMFGFTLHYDARFWISWGAVVAAFVGQLACAWIAFKEDNSEKLFLNIPLIKLSYAGAVWMLIAGSACMLIPDCPAWIAAVACALVFMFSALSVIKAKAAADAVEEVGKKVKAKTFFIKSLTVDAQTLMDSAEDEEIKAELKKVYEEIRYSDPMSSDALTAAESQITLAFAGLREAVAGGNTQQVKQKAKEVLILVKDRNNKCKLVK